MVFGYIKVEGFFIPFTIHLNISKKPLLYCNMNPDEENWKKEFEKFKVVQKCPKCGELSLKFSEGKIKCSECSYEQNVANI